MDHRIALKPNTPLCLSNDSGEMIHCIIKNEIGRGGSCIVYEAVRITDTGDQTLYRIKEFYPYKLHISRNNNELVPSVHDMDSFQKEQKQFRCDFSHTNKLFYSGDNYSSMTNQLDVFNQNGTSYILSAYSSKNTLAAYKPVNLKECITLIKQVVYVLGNIHKMGYLYLDIKPDNVLVVDGYQKQVQLFDFNSLFEWKKVNQPSDIRLSYTKGFAPIELQTSKIKRLGPHTDVYSVGALLFYLLFGHIPTVPDCEIDAVYDFSKIQYDYHQCDDRLLSSLCHFFHNTLAVYYGDRYQNIEKVLDQLSIIEKYADPLIPRIYSTHIIKPQIFYGREQEFKELDNLLSNPHYNCLFLSGMGGIGKSTFIKEYLTRYRERFDTVLYVYYKDSIEATVSNDMNIEINTLRQDEENKTNIRYFDKKIQKICELVRGTSAVLVIDNFTGEMDDDLIALLSTGLRIILLTRKSPSYSNCLKMELSAITEWNALIHIFEAHLGRSIEAYEIDDFKRILNSIENHTLILELIAKQIANSHITISSAAALTIENGFSTIATEKVDYERDSKQISDTIGHIIDALFIANMLSPEKKVLMKVLSLTSDEGIEINMFQKIMKLKSKDDLNELIKDGWITISRDMISMNNVIQEAVHRWEWNNDSIYAARQFLTYFYIEIRLESTKNNYPKKLRDYMTVSESLKGKLIFKKLHKWQESQWDKNGLIGKVTQERQARIKDQSPADIEKLTQLLFIAEGIIKQCQREKVICDTDLFINLQVVVLLNMPRFRDDFIISETSRILSDNIKSLDQDEDTMREMGLDAVVIMQIYELIFSISANHEDLEAILERANKASNCFKKKEAYAIYYNMLSDYYDILLDGFYDTDNQEEERILNKMLDAIEKTLFYSKKNISHDINHLYVKNILAKATILMRSNGGTIREIDQLIAEAKKLIIENTTQYADVRLQYYLVCAWYYALVHDDEDMTEVFIKDALELSHIIIPTDLQKIEDVIIPCANIYFELGCYEKAMALLYKGTRLCFKHINTDSYAIIRQQLYDHFFEVGIEAQQLEWCQKMIKLIETENKEILDNKNRVIIPEEVRSL